MMSRYIRHPAYLGWYVWTIGTQIMVLNPICLILFIVVAFFFFKDRIECEDNALTMFFKEEFIMYKKKTWSGIPLIK
jgi:protein-S-isoprenylcysteine O-methyltransferase